MRRARAFVFDIGGVLIDLDLDALVRAITDHRPAAQAKVTELRRHPSLYLVETGRITGQEYFDTYVRPLTDGWTYDDLVRAWTRIFSENRAGRRLFADLKECGYPVYLLSNLSAFNAEAIEIRFPGFFAQADGSFLSFELGHVKPEPEVYRKVTQAIGVHPGACVFLDDTPECVAGARASGLEAIRFAADRIPEIRRRISELTGGELAAAG